MVTGLTETDLSQLLCPRPGDGETPPLVEAVSYRRWCEDYGVLKSSQGVRATLLRVCSFNLCRCGELAIR